MGQHEWALSGESGEQFNPDTRGWQTGERRVGGRIVYKKRYARATAGVARVREQARSYKSMSRRTLGSEFAREQPGSRNKEARQMAGPAE
ncbi:hypothetical protein A6723_018395 [Pseudomonas sp. AU11447]|nr:hypothetical protein A6723_018395 [Pseudomonas sp. AU11447]